MERADRLKRQKEFLIRAAYWTALGGLAILVLRYAAAVLFPFVLAFAVAWALSFPVDFVTERLPMGRKTTAVLIVVLFYALLALLFYLLGYQILNLLSGCTDQLSRFFQESVSPLFRRASAWGEEFFAGDAGGLAVAAGRTGDMAAEISGKVVDGVSAVAGHIPGICMDLFLTVIATLLIELEFPDICAFLAAQVPERFRQYAQNVRKYVLGTLGKCMLSYCLILGLTFAELVAGLLLLRVEGAFLIAFLIALLDILPVFGDRDGLTAVGGNRFLRGRSAVWRRSGGAVPCDHCDPEYRGTASRRKADGALAGCDASFHDTGTSFSGDSGDVFAAACDGIFKELK